MLKFYVDNSAPLVRPYIACGIVLITPIMALEEEVLKTLNRGIWRGCRRLEAAAPKGYAACDGERWGDGKDFKGLLLPFYLLGAGAAAA